MWISASIRRHINLLSRGALFTTRDCLCYGSRAAVDQALYRLVKSGHIERLARGVFMKPDLVARVVPALEVACVKAAAFGKQIITDAADAAVKLGVSMAGNRETTFAVSGRSSAFRYGGEIISFKGCSARKIRLGDSRVGLSMRALWHQGRTGCNSGAVLKATMSFNRLDHDELRKSGALIPAWLTNWLWCFRQ